MVPWEAHNPEFSLQVDAKEVDSEGEFVNVLNYLLTPDRELVQTIGDTQKQVWIMLDVDQFPQTRSVIDTVFSYLIFVALTHFSHNWSESLEHCSVNLRSSNLHLGGSE